MKNDDPLDDLRRISRILGSRRNGTIPPPPGVSKIKLHDGTLDAIKWNLPSQGSEYVFARLHMLSRSRGPSTWGCTDIRPENAALNVIYGFVGALRRPCTPPRSRLIS